VWALNCFLITGAPSQSGRESSKQPAPEAKQGKVATQSAAALEEDTTTVSPDDPAEALAAETLMHSWGRTWLGEPVVWALCLLTKQGGGPTTASICNNARWYVFTEAE